MAMQDNLLSEIERFLEVTGWPETTFGQRAVNNGRAVMNLRNGRANLRTAERMAEFIPKQATQMRDQLRAFIPDEQGI